MLKFLDNYSSFSGLPIFFFDIYQSQTGVYFGKTESLVQLIRHERHETVILTVTGS